MQNKYIALITAYKPTVFLLDLVNRLETLGFFVVLVDDGSGAKYEHLFFDCSRHAEILYHTENKGKGRALKTGLSYILKHCPANSIVVTVDADGQHCVDDALSICLTAEQYPNSLVLGSRKLKKNVPLRSRFGNAVTRFVYRISTGLKVHDTQTGLRAFHASLISELSNVPGERYEYEINVLLHFAREKINIREHEIETIYFDNNSASHFAAVKDFVRIYKEILKFSAASLVGFLTDYAAYSLLLLITSNLSLSNIIARVISVSVIFTLNRRFVFKSKENFLKATVKYFLSVAIILFGNTLLLEFLANTCGVHQMLAKIITEVLFFTLSWLIQRLLIFKKQTGGNR